MVQQFQVDVMTLDCVGLGTSKPIPKLWGEEGASSRSPRALILAKGLRVGHRSRAAVGGCSAGKSVLWAQQHRRGEGTALGSELGSGAVSQRTQNSTVGMAEIPATRVREAQGCCLATNMTSLVLLAWKHGRHTCFVKPAQLIGKMISWI